MKTAKDLVRPNTYFRIPNFEKRKEWSSEKYKKGWEARFVFASEGDLEEARRLLKAEGLEAGRPFAKARQWVLPVYGKKAVEFFAGEKQETGTRARRIATESRSSK